MDTQEQVDNLDVVKALGVHKNVSFIHSYNSKFTWYRKATRREWCHVTLEAFRGYAHGF